MALRGQDTQVVVPNLGTGGMSVSEAKETLERAGLVVQVRLTPNAEGAGFHTGLRETDPPAGSAVPYGSTVVLYHDGAGPL